MRTVACGLLVAVLVLALGRGNPSPSIMATPEGGLITMCAPGITEGVALMGGDGVTNISSGPVRLVAVELDRSDNLELVGAELQIPTEGPNNTVGGAQAYRGKPAGIVDTPLAPGKWAIVVLGLRVTSATETGSTLGVWVTVADSQGRLTRVHLCTQFYVTPLPRVCTEEDGPEPSQERDEYMARKCGALG